MRLPYYAMLCATLLATAGISQARTTFQEVEAVKSPELTRQACALARWAVECRLKGVEPKNPPMKLHPVFSRRAGVFVTMTKGSRPRGCMGTVEPRHRSLKEEIIDNAVRAATQDLRHKLLTPSELEKVRFCVAVVGPLKPIESASELAPNLYGLLVRNGSRSGILLPGEARTASWQVKECKRKAGLPPDASVQMYIFRTVALEESTSRKPPTRWLAGNK